MPTTKNPTDIEKLNAATKAAELVKDGMLLGLGSGSTFEYALQQLADRVKKEGLTLRGVPTSKRTASLAESYGIRVVPLQRHMKIDLTIDGADEIDDTMTMIKGGGGALLREKVVAYFSRQVVIAVDSSKLVNRIGNFPLPVEVLPFAIIPVTEQIERLGATITERKKDGVPFVTDNGNAIIDCSFRDIPDGATLDRELKQIPGVIETGIFSKLVDILVVGRQQGAEANFHERD